MVLTYRVTIEQLRDVDVQPLMIEQTTVIYVDGIKTVIQRSGIVEVYFSDDIYCCHLNYTRPDWHLGLGIYDENRTLFLEKYSAASLPWQLVTGSQTVYFMSALAYGLHIDVVTLLDSAMLPATDIELSVIKLTLGQSSFYEKFGYRPRYPAAYDNFKAQLMVEVVTRLDFYTACYNFYYKRQEFDYSTISGRVLEVITLYHYNKADLMIKNITVLDLWFYTHQRG